MHPRRHGAVSRVGKKGATKVFKQGSDEDGSYANLSGKKGSFYSYRISLGHQHGCRFIVLGQQYDGRDVTWKPSVAGNRLTSHRPCCWTTANNSKRVSHRWELNHAERDKQKEKKIACPAADFYYLSARLPLVIPIKIARFPLPIVPRALLSPSPQPPYDTEAYLRRREFWEQSCRFTSPCLANSTFVALFVKQILRKKRYCLCYYSPKGCSS